MSDGRGDDERDEAVPPSLDPGPVEAEAEETESGPEVFGPIPPDAESAEDREPSPAPPYGPPVQLRAPVEWPLAAPTAPVPPPLGERPLPEIAPLAPSDRKRRSWPARIALFAVKALIVFVLGSVLWVTIYRFVGPPVTLTMIGDAIGGHGINKQWMPLSRIDPSMARAAIAAEDSRFCSHSGFDFEAIEKAYERNATGRKRIRGGSTISQQTAKNVFLWQGGGYFRKGLEAWFTLLIEAIWGKRRIMEVYLNVAETGIGTYGVNAGAQRYFRHDASRLSAQEAAQIAAVLPLPKKRPGTDPSGYTRRYGRTIAARIGAVRADNLDSCLR